jgi:DNA-binding SARP family transcriptional activator/TolB-like protein
MLQLHTLGTLDLRSPADADCAAVLAQPKRLALLIYLAAASPRRFHRRDSLLALFWPELDESHARAALRRTLYFLRNALGADAILGRGDDEIGASESLACDAAEFEAALARGDLGRALELYRGDFLAGFHVAGAPEYQDWLDRERTRFRELAAAAARKLADDAASLDRHDDAVRYSRRALSLDPHDETALRRLMTLLDASGDRAGALRAYDDFARRLMAELDLEPSGDARELRDVIARSARAAGVTKQSGGVEFDPIAASAAARHPRNDVSPSTVAVLPFAIRGDPALAWLGEGIVDLLATALDGAGEVRAADPRALLRLIQREGWQEQDPASAATIAGQVGAGRYVLGSIVSAGGRLQATAGLYDGTGEQELSVQATATGEGEVFDLVDELARQLLAAGQAGPGSRLSRLAARTTSSMPALKAYLVGERHLRAGRYYDAMESLQDAVTSDPTFALAYYRFAAAAGGCAMPELARQLADLGAEHRNRLSEHDRYLFDAQRAWLSGAVTEAEAHYATITSIYPGDVEAWFLLGDLLFHSNPLRGRSAVEARGPFERALALEPDHVTTLVHLVRIAALEGNREEALELAGRVIDLSPEGDEVLAMRAFRAYATGDDPEIRAVIGALRSARLAAIALAFTDVAVYAGDLGAAESLARELTGVARSDEMRALFHVLLAHLALARRKPDAALAELRTAERLDAAWGLETRALFAALPFGGIPQAEVVAARDALLAWDATRAEQSSFIIFAMHNGLHPHIRLYLLALIEARLGDLPAARAHAEALTTLAPVTGAEPLSHHLTRGALARVLWAEGKPSEALAELGRAHTEAWFLLTVASPFYSQAFERWMRAELLTELGRDDEADGWRTSIAERSPYEIIYREY